MEQEQAFDFAEHPHRRYNPLCGEWVLVSPHRAKRPWQGQLEECDNTPLPTHSEDCYLCPGNTRINGESNPAFQGPYVFTNDFAALTEIAPDYQQEDALFRSQSVVGTSRVICFSERHDLTLPELTLEQIRSLIDLWCQQYRELGAQYRWVQLFENKGAINGCSNPHPHGQIWASSAVPTLPTREDERQQQYWHEHRSNLLMDYNQQELKQGERIVCENDHWLVVVPYWATWPFETLLLPKRLVAQMPQLTDQERHSLAAILKTLTCKYDNLFQTSFPYSMGWHGAPFDDEQVSQHWQLHAHFYPPLLRSASIRKFMVGYEMLSEAQRDLTPEQAAEKLRSLPDLHFRAAVVSGNSIDRNHQ